MWYTICVGDGRLASYGIGNQLRKAREGLGLSVDDVADQTRIAARFLEAIEGEQLESLPGLVFTRNFVRQYANHLKLDPEPLLNALPKLDESHIQLPVPPARARSARWDSRGKSMATLAVWLLVIAGAGSAVWNYRDVNVLARLRSFYPPPRPVVQVRKETPSATVMAVNVPAQASLAGVKPGESKSTELKVVVRARETSWVSLAADGKSAFAGILQANQTQEISAVEQVKLVAGNAGGVTVSLNGRELDPIGPPGQVRVVRLTADGPEFLARAPHPIAAPL